MASTCPHPPQKGPPRSGLAARREGRGGRREREQKERGGKKREVDKDVERRKN